MSDPLIMYLIGMILCGTLLHFHPKCIRPSWDGETSGEKREEEVILPDTLCICLRINL